MSLIKVTQSAIDRSKPPESGWHKVTVTAYEEKASNDKKSVNHVFTLTVDEGGTNDGRVVFAQFNSKMIGMIAPFVDAANDVKPENASKELEFDPSALNGKSLYAKIEDSTWEGRIVKKNNEWAALSNPPESPF